MDDLIFTESHVLCKPKGERVYPIRESEWNLLERMIERIIPYKRTFQNIAAILLGTCGTSIFSLISLLSIENVILWIWITNWSILAVSFALGLFSFFIDSKLKQVTTVSKQNVLDEMVLIMKKFHKPDEENIELKKEKKSKKLNVSSAGSIRIVSDNKTMFTGAETPKSAPKLETNINAIQARMHPNWQKVDNKFPVLKDAIWIADREHITNDEALYGGQYNFTREFEIPVEKSRLEAAKIYLLVDNFCELKVNGNRINRFEGFDKLHRESILATLKEGRNVVTFIIKNEDFTRFNNPEHKQFYESKRKWEHNPYGFKYCIEIKYLER